MYTKSHTKTDNLSLKFSAFKKAKLTFSRIQKTQMYLLWLRLRHYPSRKITRIGDIYKEAFKDFLFVNKIPKVIPKVERAQFEFQFDEETLQMLDGIRKIALKRNQPLAVVVEEALQKYLNLPQNYLGEDLQKPGNIERIS